MTRSEREQYELHLAQVAFEADRAHMATLQGATAQDYLDWSYHAGARTPLVDRYRAIALAVEEALYQDRRTVFGRLRHFGAGTTADEDDAAEQAEGRATPT